MDGIARPPLVTAPPVASEARTTLLRGAIGLVTMFVLLHWIVSRVTADGA